VISRTGGRYPPPWRALRVGEMGRFGIAVIVCFFFCILAEASVVVTATGEHRYPWAPLDLDSDGHIEWVLEGNLWNVYSADGQVTMVWDGKTLSVSIRLADIVQEQPSGWVNGYPEIWYGAKVWNTLGPALDGPVPLPQKLRDLRDISVTVEYEVRRLDPHLPYNLCLETWLTRDTERGRAVRSDEVEIMIWLDYQNMRGAGTLVGQTTIGGKVYEVWYEERCGSGGWEYFAFVPRDPSPYGTVTIWWGPFLQEAMKYSRRSGWLDLYFTSVELGSEFGAPHYLRRNDLDWEVRSFVISCGQRNILGVETQ
jgi:endoglucanase